MRHYFIPHRSKLYSIIASLGAVYRYLLTFFVISIFIYTWWVFVYINVDALVKKHQVEIFALENKQQFFIKSDSEFKSLSQMMHELSAQLRMNTVKTHVSYDFLMNLFEQVKKTGIVILSCAPERQKDLPWALCNTYTLELRGNFTQIISFLHTLGTNGRIFGCKNVRCIREDQHFFKIVCSLENYIIKESV